MSICPFLKEECKKGECAMWLELFVKDAKGEQVKDENGNPKKNSNCCLVWHPVLQIESTAALLNKK